MSTLGLFCHPWVLRTPRMAGSTGCCAASQESVEWQLWAVLEVQSDDTGSDAALAPMAVGSPNSDFVFLAARARSNRIAAEAMF